MAGMACGASANAGGALFADDCGSGSGRPSLLGGGVMSGAVRMDTSYANGTSLWSIVRPMHLWRLGAGSQFLGATGKGATWFAVLRTSRVGTAQEIAENVPTILLVVA